jgi:phosphinothricin acetyltransferase
MTARDFERVADIYRAGIETGDATFETDVPAWDAWDRSHLPALRFVARGDNGVVGWAALSPVSDRCVYEGVAEVSIYIDTAVRGQGIGSALLTALVEESERAGIWTLQTGIFPENVVSIELHKRCGFRIVGTREKLGRMGARWRDVLMLERRSTVVL